IFYGSGTRAKIIEAAMCDVACPSTETGMEGISLDPDREYLHSETKEGWLKILRIVTLAQASLVRQRAREKIAYNHEARACAESFMKILQLNTAVSHE